MTRSAPGGDDIGGRMQQSSPQPAAVGAPPYRVRSLTRSDSITGRDSKQYSGGRTRTPLLPPPGCGPGRPEVGTAGSRRAGGCGSRLPESPGNDSEKSRAERRPLWTKGAGGDDSTRRVRTARARRATVSCPPSRNERTAARAREPRPDSGGPVRGAVAGPVSPCSSCRESRILAPGPRLPTHGKGLAGGLHRATPGTEGPRAGSPRADGSQASHCRHC